MRISTTRELAALSRIFSPGVMREIGRTGRSPKLARLLAEAGIVDVLSADSILADAFELAFERLRTLGNRDDYIYRSALTQKIALGRHSLRSATILNEMRVCGSKADLVILNGTATAYEIKSERDSFQRLPSQLADYRAVFASVNVVTSPAQAGAVLDIAPEDVGVLALTPRFHLRVIREAVDRPERTSPSAIVESLRIEEATDVLAYLGIPFPDVPNTQRWRVLRGLFEGLDAASVHAGMVRTLKASRSRVELEPFIKQLPRPLSAAILSADLSTTARENLRTAVRLPLSSVLTWS